MDPVLRRPGRARTPRTRLGIGGLPELRLCRYHRTNTSRGCGGKAEWPQHPRTRHHGERSPKRKIRRLGVGRYPTGPVVPVHAGASLAGNDSSDAASTGPFAFGGLVSSVIAISPVSITWLNFRS